MSEKDIKVAWSHLAEANIDHDNPHVRRAWQFLVEHGEIPEPPDDDD